MDGRLSKSAAFRRNPREYKAFPNEKGQPGRVGLVVLVEGKEIEPYIIIVTDANEVLKPIHDRMPVILDPDQYDAWLDPENRDLQRLKKML